MKNKDWEKINLEHEIVDISFYCKGDINISLMQIHQTEKQQLTLLAKYKIRTIIKFKIKLFLQRVINWIMNVSDYKVKPYDLKSELKGAKRYFKD